MNNDKNSQIIYAGYCLIISVGKLNRILGNPSVGGGQGHGTSFLWSPCRYGRKGCRRVSKVWKVLLTIQCSYLPYGDTDEMAFKGRHLALNWVKIYTVGSPSPFFPLFLCLSYYPSRRLNSLLFYLAAPSSLHAFLLLSLANLFTSRKSGSKSQGREKG